MNVDQKILTTSYEDPEGKPLSRGNIQLRWQRAIELAGTAVLTFTYRENFPKSRSMPRAQPRVLHTATVSLIGGCPVVDHLKEVLRIGAPLITLRAGAFYFGGR
jgi:hypothetical protein